MAELKKILKEFLLKATITDWNGHKIELGKVYTNFSAFAFNTINEADENKKLRVFDFDDTLVKTKSHIYIKHSDGKESKLTPGEYAIYEPKQGDKFDFSDFEQVKQPQEIKGITNLLRKIVNKEGERKVVILTARSAYKPVKDYLKDIGLEGIYVIALADADPQKKADWIEDKIKKGYNDVFFIDDSQKNVQAVSGLKKKYPNIKMKVQQVKHEVPQIPKNTFDRKSNNKPNTSGNMKLQSLLPKSDLDKTIKNPETGRKIKIKSALGYDKSSQVYKTAVNSIKK